MSLYRPGDIVVVSFPFTDLSKAKNRPALVISNSQVNNTGDYILLQITSKDRTDQFSMMIQEADYQGRPLPLTSYLRMHKIFTLQERLIRYRYTRVCRDFRTKVITALSKMFS
jgi:mRNA interferase MazF